MPDILNVDRVVNGSYGSLFAAPIENTVGAPKFLTQVRDVSFRVSANKQEMLPVGDNWQRYKKLSYAGDGTFTLWKATSDFMKAFIDAIERNTVPQYTLNVVLNDPESLGIEEVQLFKVKVWELPGGFTTGEILEEAIQFTFEGIKIIKEITGNLNS